MSANPVSFTPVSELGEFGLIQRIEEILGPVHDEQVRQSIGDDAAVYGTDPVHLITTDVLVERIHFDRTFSPMEHLGFKALSVNVSDIVAMNGRARYATVGLGLPNNASVETVEAIYRGLAKAGKAYGVHIIGGDVSASRDLFISITVVGEAGPDRVVYRKGARPGDLLCVTGDVGSAYAGLKVLLEHKKRFLEEGEGFESHFSSYPYIIERQLKPQARTDVIEIWEQTGIVPHALIDISDGLASELFHLCKQSQCGAVVTGATLPIDLQTRMVANDLKEDVDTYALFGGEDYELLCALSANDVKRLANSPIDLVVIGEFRPQKEGIHIRTDDGETVDLSPDGYRHF